MIEKDSGNIPVPTLTLCHPGPIPMIQSQVSRSRESKRVCSLQVVLGMTTWAIS